MQAQQQEYLSYTLRKLKEYSKNGLENNITKTEYLAAQRNIRSLELENRTRLKAQNSNNWGSH